jgi:hypothetical protein
MARNIRVRAIKRREVDEDKLALAFLMLAKVLHEQARPAVPDNGTHGTTTAGPEAV